MTWPCFGQGVLLDGVSVVQEHHARLRDLVGLFLRIFPNESLAVYVRISTYGIQYTHVCISRRPVQR